MRISLYALLLLFLPIATPGQVPDSTRAYVARSFTSKNTLRSCIQHGGKPTRRGTTQNLQENHMGDIAGTTMYSTMVRAGKTTYFVDVKEAKNGRKFVSITENRIDDGEKKVRSTIRIFGESIEQFRQAINEAAASVIQ
jgi:hypothetical protein